MAKVNYKALVESYQKFPTEAPKLLKESLEAKDIAAKDFSWLGLFEACFGWEEVRACREDKSRLVNEHVFEAAGGVTTAAFQNISGQIVYQLTMDAYTNEEFVFTPMIPEYNSIYQFEKAADITGIGPGTDAGWKRAESEPYTTAGVGEDWINLPQIEDRGKIVPVTWEAIFYDRTGQVQTKCQQVGYWLGYNREVRCIDCVIDENETAASAAVGGHRYHWRGTSIQTYGNNSGTHTWDNLAGANGALIDWTDVDAMEQLLNAITDPNTGAPYLITADTLIVTKENEKAANRIVGATQVQTISPGYATSGNPTLTVSSNPYSGMLTVKSSRLLAQRMATDTTYYLGTPKTAFRYVVHEKFSTAQAPPNSKDEFERRIVAQYRANERGGYATVQPRVMVKATVA